MLSKSSKYALKAVLYLAVNSNENFKIMAKDIGKPINVPKAYIAKILQELAKNQLVSSSRGPQGGFYLTKENKERPLIDIVHLIDGKDRINSCMLSIKECDEENPCPFHRLIGAAKIDFRKNLEKTTINDLVRDIKENKSFLPL
ncbi:Rrf2 family transcriptional regulator [Flavobacteriaceae bacterium KMM 6898]|nr:Rrf2 family transcriptional regulator [Flavobacteriaceae bacterium KMM 6898]